MRTFGLSVAASMLIAAGLMSMDRAWAAEPATAVAATPAVSSSLALVLAIDQNQPQGAADWKMTPVVAPAGTNAAASLTAPPSQYLTLERKAGLSGDCEWIVSYRIPPAVAGSKGPTGGCQVQVSSVATAEKPAQLLHFSSGLGAGAPYISYAASVQNPKPPKDAAKPISGHVFTVPVTERSLAWSEEMRRTIESQIAGVPKVPDMVQTLRWVVEGDKYKCWMNGRYIGEYALEAGMDWSGPVRIMLNPGTELLSVRARPYGEKPARFEPLSISGFLNGAGPGCPAKAGVDPIWQGKATVSGVPFEFPAAKSGPNAKNDHIDVGQSWSRFGAISGYIASNFGTFGGRWISADRIDPSRICMYVPQGRYKALHLMAVSEDKPDTVPVVTAQFYRPDAGHPFNFAGRVPTSEAKSNQSESMTMTMEDGSTKRVHHVVIPLDPDAFSWFTDLPRIGLEITKQVQYYRAYPDPLEYSYHGAGLPSSVKIYAMTLERAGVEVEVTPENYGHVWTAPAQPGYSVELKNRSGKGGEATVVVSTKSEDGLGVPATVGPRLRARSYAVQTRFTEQSYGEPERLALTMVRAG